MRNKAEQTAIYLLLGLFMLSITALIQHTTVGYARTSAEELCPALYSPADCESSMPEQKTVYFTFDDGPSKNTETILDILDQNGVKATFFVTAQCSDNADVPALMRRILADGHEVGLHAYTHKYSKIYSSLEGYLQEMDAINRYVEENTGYSSAIVRFPGGSCTSNASKALMKRIINEMEERRYVYYDWDVDSGDGASKVISAERLADNIVSGAEGQRVVVLLHDSPGPVTTPRAVELAIPRLREMGYTFDKLAANIEPPQLRRP